MCFEQYCGTEGDVTSFEEDASEIGDQGSLFEDMSRVSSPLVSTTQYTLPNLTEQGKSSRNRPNQVEVNNQSELII